MIILKCPFCYLQGEKKNLCEILEDGAVKIQRHSQYDNTESTIVNGDNLSIKCGKCQNEVYYQETKIWSIPPIFNVMEMMGTMLL